MNNQLLSALGKEGVLLSVSVRYWRARKKLTASDLGINPDKVDNRLISLGHKRLLPKESLQQLSLIESRAHALVESNTFPFLNGVARYLPNSKLEEVTEKLRVLEEEFMQRQSAFFSEYSELRIEALKQWESQADELSNEPARVLAVIRSAFPDPAELPKYFAFKIRLFAVSIPDVPQAEMISYGEQQSILRARKAAADTARREIETSCREFIGDCVSALRAETAKLCEEMLSTISGTKSVHQKTLNRLVRFVDHFRELNFTDDEEMEQQLENVRSQFLTMAASEYRDSRSNRNRLVNGLSALRDTAKRLSREDSSHLVERFGKSGRRKFQLAS